MKETYEFLKERAKVFYLATINGDRPSNRPFGALILFDNKIYTMTHKEKEVSKQIEFNNKVCIVACAEGEWLRINCDLIDDSENQKVKKAMMEEYPWTKEEGSGYSLNNPNFQILYFANVEAIIYKDKSIINKYNF